MKKARKEGSSSSLPVLCTSPFIHSLTLSLSPSLTHSLSLTLSISLSLSLSLSLPLSLSLSHTHTHSLSLSLSLSPSLFGRTYAHSTFGQHQVMAAPIFFIIRSQIRFFSILPIGQIQIIEQQNPVKMKSR